MLWFDDALRGLSRTFGVSRNTVTAWLKKNPDPTAAGDDLNRCSSGQCLDWTFVRWWRGECFAYLATPGSIF